jgi:chromosome segregation ATPase
MKDRLTLSIRNSAMQDSTVFAFPRNDQDRLRLALRRLEEAVTEQQAAIRDFRASLGELRQAATGLEDSLGTYRHRLDDTATSLRQAQAATLQLGETATKMEAMG